MIFNFIHTSCFTHGHCCAVQTHLGRGRRCSHVDVQTEILSLIASSDAHSSAENIKSAPKFSFKVKICNLLYLSSASGCLFALNVTLAPCWLSYETQAFVFPLNQYVNQPLYVQSVRYQKLCLRPYVHFCSFLFYDPICAIGRPAGRQQSRAEQSEAHWMFLHAAGLAQASVVGEQ